MNVCNSSHTLNAAKKLNTEDAEGAEKKKREREKYFYKECIFLQFEYKKLNAKMQRLKDKISFCWSNP